MNDKLLGSLIGLAIGDAVGTTLEFKEKGSFQPITDMVGGGPFYLTAGQWTDDTSMALCLANSLIEKGFDAHDQAEKYLSWYKTGYMSVTGRCFDIGTTTRVALLNFEKTNNPYSGGTDPWSSGNGSLMRLAPIAMYYANDIETASEKAELSSMVTHSTDEAKDACKLFVRQLIAAYQGKSKQEILEQFDFKGAPKIWAIAQGCYFDKTEEYIFGTGYVVDSLEAALWSFMVTDNFRDAILTAANLGDDADTTAAICGQIAGAYYGLEGIPQDWKDKLHWYDQILEIGNNVLTASEK